jgi:hypothetical protein
MESHKAACAQHARTYTDRNSIQVIVEAHNDVLGGTASLYNQILDTSRWILITKSFVSHIAGYANWPVSIVLILFIYALLMGFDTRETLYQILLLLIFLGQISGYFFIYLITPHDLLLHINTSMQRLVFHVSSIIILWLFVALRSSCLYDMDQVTE